MTDEPVDPRFDRLAERLEAASIAARDGWLPRTALRNMAFRREEVTSQDLDALFDVLVRSGRLETRCERYSGKHGGRTHQYRPPTPVVVAPKENVDDMQTT